MNMRNILWHARQFSAFFLALVGGLVVFKDNGWAKGDPWPSFLGVALCALGLTFLWSTRSKE